MSKSQKITLVVVCVGILVPILSLFAYGPYSDYRESLNSFTLADVCKVQKGMNIDTAWAILGHPIEYHNYNFSNAYSSQCRNLNKNHFIEIIYTADEGTVIDVFFFGGGGRTKTLVESGVCVNQGG